LLSIFTNGLGSCGPRNARKSIYGSNASYSSPKSNQILGHNFGSLSERWRHKRTTKIVKLSLILTTPTKNPKPKRFFLLQTRRLHESFDGSNNSLSCSSGELSQAASGRLMLFLQFCAQRGFWATLLVQGMLEGCCGQWPNYMDKYVRTGTSAL